MLVIYEVFGRDVLGINERKIIDAIFIYYIVDL